MHRGVQLTVAAAAAMLATYLIRYQAPPGMPTPVLSSPAAAAGVSALPSGKIKGVCYAHSWGNGGRDGYASEKSAETLQRLAELGVNAVSLTPFGFLRSPEAGEVALFNNNPQMESDQRIAVDAERARKAGMGVMLKPHIWIHHGKWTGDWQPKGKHLADFRSSYRRFAVHYAGLAAEIGAHWYCLGNEIDQLVIGEQAYFRELIAELRTHYRGKLGYCANWDKVGEIPLWDALDFIALNEYSPLADDTAASDEQLRAAARDNVARLTALAKRAGKPVIVTEIGFRSAPAAFTKPWYWPEHDDSPFDGQAQHRAYDAALPVYLAADGVAGIFLWKWFSDSQDEFPPIDFPPSGKPAEASLKAIYAADYGPKPSSGD